MDSMAQRRRFGEHRQASPEPDAKVGDRIELVSMGDDPCPLPAGATGTVDFVNPVSQIGNTPAHVQYGVKWDAPHERRSLMLVCPPDQFKVLP